MKYSVLELTQNILSSLDSDEVNSISDTTEATQVANIVRTAYFNIISRADLPEHRQIFSLDASGDNLLPVLMTKPDNVRRIDWIKYNKADTSDPDNFGYVTILPLQQFMDHIHQFSTDETDVGTMDLDGFTFYFKDEKQPDFCTIINDYQIVFDSYDSAFDTTLQETKTMCFGLIVPSFTMADAFIPEMDEQQFPLLLNEAKSIAFIELKQMANEAAVQESRRQWRTLQRTKSLAIRPNYFDMLPNFGRR